MAGQDKGRSGFVPFVARVGIPGAQPPLFGQPSGTRDEAEARVRRCTEGNPAAFSAGWVVGKDGITEVK